MKRLTRAAFLKAGATAAGALAACGPVPSGTPERAAAEPVAIQYWFTDSPPWAQIRTDMVARFTQQQREVQVEPVIKTIDQAVDAAAAAGTPPDVADVYTFDVVPRWTRNSLVDLAGQGDRAWATFARSDPYARFEADEVARYGYAGVPKLPEPGQQSAGGDQRRARQRRARREGGRQGGPAQGRAGRCGRPEGGLTARVTDTARAPAGPAEPVPSTGLADPTPPPSWVPRRGRHAFGFATP